jgi:hypothetical protein
MTAYSVTIGLLLAFPWTLVGMILLGTAASSAKRWLDNCRWCPIRHHKTGVSGR